MLELNASNDRGIDVVRNRIKTFAHQKVTLPKGRHKIIILDEADRYDRRERERERKRERERDVKYCISLKKFNTSNYSAPFTELWKIVSNFWQRSSCVYAINGACMQLK